MRKTLIYSMAICVSIAGFSNPTYAKRKKKDTPPPAAEAPKKDAKKTIKEIIKPTKSKDGLFTLYQDTTNGSVYMKIRKDQLNKEFVYFNYSENGAVSAGFFKGSFRDNEVFSIRKYYDKIEFVKENTNYYFDAANAISKSSDANINKPILASLKIAAEEAAIEILPAVKA